MAHCGGHLRVWLAGISNGTPAASGLPHYDGAIRVDAEQCSRNGDNRVNVAGGLQARMVVVRLTAPAIALGPFAARCAVPARASERYGVLS